LTDRLTIAGISLKSSHHNGISFHCCRPIIHRLHSVAVLASHLDGCYLAHRLCVCLSVLNSDECKSNDSAVSLQQLISYTWSTWRHRSPHSPPRRHDVKPPPDVEARLKEQSLRD